MDRRYFLSSAIVAASTAGTSVNLAADIESPASKSDASRDISQMVVSHVVRTRYADLSAGVALTAKHSIMDALGVSLAATGLEPACKAFADMSLADGGSPKSELFGRNHRVPAAAAAWANGALAHALDYEDVHDPSGMHANAAVIPAALAIAQAEGGISGADFIAAIVVGSDLVCRLGLSRLDNPIDFGWYFPPIVSAFGATAACCKLLGLTESQTLDALSLTLCQSSCSSELVDSPNSSVRAIRDAFPCQTAVRSAYLARAGVRGFERPFEGAGGFGKMYLRGHWNPDALISGLGQTFHGSEVSFKAWPSCRGSHVYVQSALDIATEHSLTSENIQTILVTVDEVNKMLCEPAATKSAPQTSIDAKFSIPYTVGLAVAKRTITLDSFSGQMRADPEVLAVARRVSYAVGKSAQVRDPAASVLKVRCTDGQEYSHPTGDLYGSPRRPKPEAALKMKFADCCSHAAKPVSKQRVEHVMHQIATLETMKDLRQLDTL